MSGFVREPGLSSFVGQYPIPIVHGLTVGELAQMIRGERWPGAELPDRALLPFRDSSFNDLASRCNSSADTPC